MIPNGKQIIIDGHNLTFESEPSDCRGCFFENRDSCPDCDEGIWVDEGSPWHTWTPTEEGWYLCAYGDNFYCANYWQGGTWKNQWGGTLLAYQKIEPYEASKENT